MPKNFSFWPPNTPGAVLRMVVVVLAAANLIAGFLVLRPIGGSAAQLRQQSADLRLQLRQRQGALERTRKFVDKIEAGRTEAPNLAEVPELARVELDMKRLAGLDGPLDQLQALHQ